MNLKSNCHILPQNHIFSEDRLPSMLQMDKVFSLLLQILTVNKKQLMYVERNTETPSRYHCCSGKEIIITYSVCVSVFLL
jgi:hypothetical protein